MYTMASAQYNPNGPLTELEIKQRERARLTMMRIGIVSIVMLFAGLTSAYILRMGQKGWESIDMPTAFIISTILIILSSGTMYWAQLSARKSNKQGVVTGVLLTLLLGLGFAYTQFMGYGQLVAEGHFLVGSNPASSFLYFISGAHLAHMAGGLLSLIVTAARASRGKYTADSYTGLKLTAIYWHFLDILWVYLFVFLYLIR